LWCSPGSLGSKLPLRREIGRDPMHFRQETGVGIYKSSGRLPEWPAEDSKGRKKINKPNKTDVSKYAA
jgi:hypothetical protein